MFVCNVVVVVVVVVAAAVVVVVVVVVVVAAVGAVVVAVCVVDKPTNPIQPNETYQTNTIDVNKSSQN